jgi:hypothetical protein
VTARGFSSTDTPLAVDDVETAVFEGEAVLFRESTRSVHRVSGLAAAVWMLCDGGTSVDDIATELSDVFATPLDEITPTVIDALAKLDEAQLLVRTDGNTTIVLTDGVELAPDGSRLIACPPDT